MTTTSAPATGRSWPLADLTATLQEAIEGAAAEGHNLSVAVVDGGGHLVCFGRHPAARTQTVTTAIGKARCAVFYDRPSSVTAEIAARAPLAFTSFLQAAELPYVISDGGFVLMIEGAQFGIGVAGAAHGKDGEVGQAIADRFAEVVGSG